jgi:hypothetical protein
MCVQHNQESVNNTCMADDHLIIMLDQLASTTKTRSSYIYHQPCTFPDTSFPRVYVWNSMSSHSTIVTGLQEERTANFHTPFMLS